MRYCTFCLGVYILVVWYAFTVGPAESQEPCVPNQIMDGYCELAEAVILKKMDLLQTQFDALEERVAALEEE